MSEFRLRMWDVWHARFAYDGGKGCKYRPVIILEHRLRGSYSMMITSATNKLAMPHDYLIQDWQQAGLDKPSIARADRIARITEANLGSAGRIGHLSEHDIAGLRIVMRGLDGPNEWLGLHAASRN